MLITMKGMSTIIVMILLVILVVAIIGLAWSWSTGLFGQITGSANDIVDNSQTTMGTSFSIISAREITTGIVSVTIRNTGTSEIDISKMGAFVDGDMKSIIDQPADPIEVGSIALFNVTGITNPVGKKLRLVPGSGPEQTTTIT